MTIEVFDFENCSDDVKYDIPIYISYSSGDSFTRTIRGYLFEKSIIIYVYTLYN